MVQGEEGVCSCRGYLCIPRRFVEAGMVGIKMRFAEQPTRLRRVRAVRKSRRLSVRTPPCSVHTHHSANNSLALLSCTTKYKINFAKKVRGLLYHRISHASILKATSVRTL